MDRRLRAFSTGLFIASGVLLLVGLATARNLAWPLGVVLLLAGLSVEGIRFALRQRDDVNPWDEFEEDDER